MWRIRSGIVEKASDEIGGIFELIPSPDHAAARLIQERGGDSLSPKAFSLVSL